MVLTGIAAAAKVMNKAQLILAAMASRYWSTVLTRFNAVFDYLDVPKDKIEFVYKNNMLRIIFKNEFAKEGSFGTIKDVDGTEYTATEVQIHTPAEHTFDGSPYDMEI